jgi:4-pyridoxolactonase
MDRGQVFWNAPGGSLVTIQAFAVLIEHDGGLLLADTGFDLARAREALPFFEPSQTPDQSIRSQIERCGFDVGDVDTIFNSHLHFDHSGGNRHFGHATVLVHERELRQAREPATFEALAYSDTSWDHADALIQPFVGDHQLAPGLRIYETPGHSAGHCSLLIEPSTGTTPLLIGFDVAYTEIGFERGIQPTMHIDPIEGQNSIQRVKDVARTAGATVCVLHDPAAWAELPSPPEAYEL